MVKIKFKYAAAILLSLLLVTDIFLQIYSFKVQKQPERIVNYITVGEVSLNSETFKLIVFNESDICIKFDNDTQGAYRQLDTIDEIDLSNAYDYTVNKTKYLFDIKPINGKTVCVNGKEAKTKTFSFTTGVNDKTYDFEFWCAIVPTDHSFTIELK